MYRIQLTELAAQMLRNLETTARNQIIRKIEQLREDPVLLGKPLVGPLKDYRSVRAAGQRCRIVCRIQEDQVLVIVAAAKLRRAGDKKDIYELMKKLVKTGIVQPDR